MNITEEFLKAAIPDRVTVFGVKLRPLSIGHVLLLMRLDNPVVFHQPGEILPLASIVEGITVCTRGFYEAQEYLASPGLRASNEKLAKSFRKPRRKSFFRKPAPFDARHCEASRTFITYFSVLKEVPFTAQDAQPGVNIGSPSLLLMLTALTADHHQKFKDAIDQPIALSRWLLCGNAERKGNLEIRDRTEFAKLQAESDAFEREQFGGKSAIFDQQGSRRPTD